MKCGLLGRKLGHSYSPSIHAVLADYEYDLYEKEPEELENFLKEGDFTGLNVTIPYKKDVIPYLFDLEPTAECLGAVNTIVRLENGQLIGFNTDYGGFRSMVNKSGLSVRGKKVLVLGSGGASNTAVEALEQMGAMPVVISRSGENNYENLHRHADADLIINATPVGMFPRCGESPVDLRAFPQCSGVLDAIYNPRRTALLLQAEELGIPCSDGLPMLVAQAVAAEEYFFDKTIPASETERILRLLRSRMTNIVLIGMPGSGKTTVGEALEQLTGREAIDLDREIVRRAGRSIPEIFASDGEASFRELERQVTTEIGAMSGKLILTGGGVVKDPRNYAPLHQNGRIYHIWRELDVLPVEGRPISQRSSAEALWAERKPLYEAFRDALVDNNGTVEETAQAIWRDFCEDSGT